ncbi:hypothetical protein [Roseivirga misakiensis]|uniref:Uncharacterized protein n=1 Tax=Roseivirga misakiensis TaxID=1563681 RepID=A0A1E5SYG0_9BACT|nr:hypothetical protein [Roseivirga misakiensis]OEK04168.1 hypothetical protein BFP71_11835 [Roseivirga misakiensis]
MEFDLSTIVYLVLGVIYFIFTSANKNKKKVGRRPSNPDNTDNPETVGPPPLDRRPTFEELLEEFTGQKSQPEPEPVRIPQLEEIKESHKKPDYLFESKPKPEVIKVKKEERKPMVTFEEYEQEEESQSEYLQMFSDLDSAKKAFIASEIFQRKY